MQILKVMILAAVTFGIAATSIPGQNHKGLERTTSSEVATRTDKEKGIIVTTTNRRFTFADVYPDNLVSDENFRTLLLLEEFRSERILRAEGQQGTVTVQAWIGKDDSPREKLWTINQEGDEGAIADRFYRVTRHGCCGAEDTYVLFNIMNGAKVFTSTAPLFQIDVPNTSNALKRYVAYLSDMASIPYPESNNTQTLAGVVEYGSESKVLGRVMIRFKGNSEDTGTPKIQMLYRQKLADSSPLELWGADKKNDRSSLSAFSIVLSYTRNNRIVIPVSNDALQIARTPLNPTFALSLEPGPQK
jgi:hypothetical protein